MLGALTLASIIAAVVTQPVLIVPVALLLAILSSVAVPPSKHRPGLFVPSNLHYNLNHEELDGHCHVSQQTFDPQYNLFIALATSAPAIAECYVPPISTLVGALICDEKIRAIYPQPVGSPPDRRIELMNRVLKEAINRRERMIANRPWDRKTSATTTKSKYIGRWKTISLTQRGRRLAESTMKC